ncbi:CCCH zinc finger and RRM domain protein [Aspergillus candidus]|uniref:CCCH zinc finger and RRM domain protein n=1 Tax=Aspergillus candidus TaxID=41067 RepID=A0A2I2FB22_ASPCN|nr:hypothetical protein BDW47DRAFT_106454 [Aspergillus candidus]PLB37832.1 hypothetical protein BDW47DRAFT_106454 [Aspergillus candidus]
MQLTESEANDVKQWVVKKLEDISDADSDVLADYVLALIRSDVPDDEIRKASVENLEDFLREHTAQFVDELFATFAQKPNPPAPAVQPQSQSQFSHDAPPHGASPQQPFFPQGPASGPTAGAYGSPMAGMPQSQDSSPNFNRKRSFHEGFQMDQDREEEVPQNRAFKTPRRGRGGGRGDWMGRDGRGPPTGPGQFPAPGPGGFPGMPPAFPPFDQNDPMAAMMAFQSMGFPQMPGMPMPMPPGPGGAGQPQEQMVPKSSERCPFYETQGICYLGATCPYQHDVVPSSSNADEYDPKSANILTDFQRPHSDSPMRGGERGRGRGRGRGDRGGFGGRGRRSEFSSAGPNEDTSITTIVVEQIPDEKLDETSVREFFSQYGEIVDVSIQPHRRLALVTYDGHAAAKRAWSSPKVIFDNRFVKVYWHKPKGDKNGERPTSGDDMAKGPAFNQEEFEKQQEAAQKAHEEKLQKRKEMEEAMQALDKQREELMKKQQEEKQRLLEKIGQESTSNGAQSPDGMSQTPPQENANDQTKQLRAQLAALEAEAKTLGIDPNSAEAGASYPFRGRGRGYGRGGFAPRGRGGYDPSHRGGFRGRGGGVARGRGGVLRLDNRPRRVAVSGVTFDSEKDEAFKQFLLNVGDYESIEPSTEQPDTLVVTFKQRFIAEKFMFGSWKIPGVGEVQLTWVANPPPALSTASTGTGSDGKAGTGTDDDTAMDTTSAPSLQQDHSGGAQVDYDVAEMEDNWDVE